MLAEQEPSFVDVLIIGAGPSGQADGIQSRTFEIFDSLDIGIELWHESNHMLEMCFWSPDTNGAIRRTDRLVDTIVGLSRFQQATLHQARIEHLLQKYIQQHSNISVERGLVPESLSVGDVTSDEAATYPVAVMLREVSQSAKVEYMKSENQASSGSQIPNGMHRSNLSTEHHDGQLDHDEDLSVKRQLIRAKYLVGCDGAHSWTRRQLGITMEGSRTDYLWGVLDIVPITDFPDIRYRCAIHSEKSGSMMIIPRENKVVRLYIQLSEEDETSSMDRSQITLEKIVLSAQKIMAPYRLSYKKIHWWTGYQIGQRVGSQFSAEERVFLAGDAVHTHSPKAGQGMNVSMHDTYNLGWKLASVIKGRATPKLLSTYDIERRQVAHDLIDFDHKLSTMFSRRPAKNDMDQAGVDMVTFKELYRDGNMFSSGVATRYDASIITASSSKDMDSRLSSQEHLATAITIGMRMPSHKIINISDARPWHLQEKLKSNGSWRILVFPGDISRPYLFDRLQQLGTKLAEPDSFYRRFNCKNQDESCLGIEILTIHAAKRDTVELLTLHEVYHPFSETDGWDYDKVFVDDESYHEGHGQAYMNYGIDPLKGAVVILRPDQHVSWIGALEDLDAMENFFNGFMLEIESPSQS